MVSAVVGFAWIGMEQRIVIMKHRHSERTRSLEDHLADEASRLHEQAKILPPGAIRQDALRKARHAEIAMHINAWLTSPAVRPPKAPSLP
jgi:hypothetical protein